MERLVTPAELEEHTGVPATTLAQWRYLGKGPRYVKIGRHVRYRSSDIAAWEELHLRGGDSS